MSHFIGATGLNDIHFLQEEISINSNEIVNTSNYIGNLTTDDIDEGSTNLYSQFITSGTDIYYNSGGVGIGTTTVGSYKLNCQGGNILLDVGRGDCYFENNATEDQQNGTGITLRTSDNPSTNGTDTDGHIFNVRSSGYASRLFVGQLLTSTGYNEYFGVGGNSTTVGGDITDYKFMINTNKNNIEFGGYNAIDWNTANNLKLGTGFTTTTVINDLDVNGDVVATSFTGDGSALTNLPLSDYATIIYVDEEIDWTSNYTEVIDTQSSNYIKEYLGLDIETDIATGNTWLSIYNDSQNTGQDDDDDVGNIQFYHLWNEKEFDILQGGYYDTGNDIKTCHTRIGAETGRLHIYWHLGDTDFIPDNVDDFLRDNFTNGWYDPMEELVILYNAFNKSKNDLGVDRIKPDTCLKTETYNLTKKQLYVNLYDNHFKENNSWNDRLEIKLNAVSGLEADTNGLSVKTDINTLGIGTVSPIENELYVKVNSTGGIGTSTTGLKVLTDDTTIGISTNKLYVKTKSNGGIGTSTGLEILHNTGTFGIGTTDNKLYLKDNAITTAKILNDAVDGDKIKYDVNFFKTNATTKALELKLDPSGGIIEDPSGTKLNLDTTDGGLHLVGNELNIKYDNSTLHTETNTLKVKDLGITTAKIANNAITTSKILNDNITSDKLATYSVTNAKIANDAITNAKLATNAVSTVKITDDAITNAKIATDAITTVKIANDAVDATKIDYDTATLASTVGNKLQVKDNVFNPRITTINNTTGTTSYPTLSISGDKTALTLERPKTMIVSTLAGGTVSTLSYNSGTHTFTYTPKIALNPTEIGVIDGKDATTLSSANSFATAADTAQSTALTTAFTTADSAIWSAVGGLATVVGLDIAGGAAADIADAITDADGNAVELPLIKKEGGLGLLYNTAELALSSWGSLQLNDIYGRLIDWSLDAYGANRVFLVGKHEYGILDLKQDHTINDFAKWNNNIIEPRTGGSTGAINCTEESTLDTFQDRWGYATSGLFTDNTKLTVSFWAKTHSKQEYQTAPDEEVVFHTHNNFTDGGSGSDNGINIKFNFGDSSDIRFKLYIRYNTTGGNVEKEIWNNWDGLGSGNLTYAYNNSSSWHNYTYVFNLTNVKLYIDGSLYGTHTLDFGGDTPNNMYNLDYHIFRGYNQDYGAGTTALTRQYWRGYLADMIIVNDDLNATQVNDLQTNNNYTGDQKVFADRLKISSDFAVNGNNELTLSASFPTVADLDEELLYTSNYIVQLNNTSNTFTSNYIKELDEWSSNYTDVEVLHTSNYVDENTFWKLQNDIIYSTKASNVNIGYGIHTDLLFHIDFEDLTNINDSSITDKTGRNIISSVDNQTFSDLRSTDSKIGNYSLYGGISNPEFYFTDNETVIPAGTKKITVAYWVKFENSNYQTMFRFRGNRFTSILNNGLLNFIIISENSYKILKNANFWSIYGANWVHLVFTVNYYNDDMRVYVNGIDETDNWESIDNGIGLSATHGFEPQTGDPTLEANMAGFLFTPLSNYHFEGYLDDFRCYSKLLTPAEIYELSTATYYEDYEMTVWGNCRALTFEGDGSALTNLPLTDYATISYVDALDTDDINEGINNLYYTDARFDTRLSTKTTTDLEEGSKLYYTTVRANTDFDTQLATKTTTDLTEGTNLYYTDARFDTRLGTKTTTDITEGTNLYYTDARFDTRLGTKTTTNLTEGTNLYYTDARFDTRLATKTTTDLTEGTKLYYTDARFDTRLVTKTTDNLNEGTTNKYSQFTTTGTDIYYNGGNVGIGTTDPDFLFHVEGTSKFTNTINILNGNDHLTTTKDLFLIGYNGNETYRHTIKSRHSHDTNNKNSIDFYTWIDTQSLHDIGNNHVASFTSGGVGIGKTDPVYALDVNGTVNATAFIGDGSSLTNLPNGTNLWSKTGNDLYYTLGNIGIGTATPSTKLDVNGTITADNVNIADSIICTNINTLADNTYLSYNSFVKIQGHNTSGTTIQLLNNVNAVIVNFDVDKSAYFKGNVEITNNLLIEDQTSCLNGNNYIGTTKNQFLFGYNGNETYRHSIKSRHRGDLYNNQNAIDFYMWNIAQNSTDIGNSHIMSITAGGVGIGTTSPSVMLDVEGDVDINGDLTIYDNLTIYDYLFLETDIWCIKDILAYERIQFKDQSKTIIKGYKKGTDNDIFYVNSATGTQLALTFDGNLYITGILYDEQTLSDRKIKRNITTIPSYESIEKMKKINIVSYDKRFHNDTQNYGVIADEIQQVFPEFVKTIEPPDKIQQDIVIECSIKENVLTTTEPILFEKDDKVYINDKEITILEQIDDCNYKCDGEDLENVAITDIHYKKINVVLYQRMIPLLVSSIQNLNERLEKLEKKGKYKDKE